MQGNIVQKKLRIWTILHSVQFKLNLIEIVNPEISSKFENFRKISIIMFVNPFIFRLNYYCMKNCSKIFHVLYEMSQKIYEEEINYMF